MDSVEIELRFGLDMGFLFFVFFGGGCVRVFSFSSDSNMQLTVEKR